MLSVKEKFRRIGILVPPGKAREYDSLSSYLQKHPVADYFQCRTALGITMDETAFEILKKSILLWVGGVAPEVSEPILVESPGIVRKPPVKRKAPVKPKPPETPPPKLIPEGAYQTILSISSAEKVSKDTLRAIIEKMGEKLGVGLEMIEYKDSGIEIRLMINK
jgi:hypothetical protein